MNILSGQVTCPQMSSSVVCKAVDLLWPLAQFIIDHKPESKHQLQGPALILSVDLHGTKVSHGKILKAT